MVHIPKTGGTTLTYTFGPHSDMIAKYPFLAPVLDLSAPNQLRWKFNESAIKARLLEECWNELPAPLQEDPRGLGYQSVAHHCFAQHSLLTDPVNQDVLSTRESYFKFAFVRNPFDYMFSLFLDKSVRPQMSGPDPAPRRRELLTEKHFADFVANAMDRPEALGMFVQRSQLSYIVDLTGEVAVDHVARFERYDEEVALLCRHLDVERAEVTREQENRANFEGLAYADFYDATTRGRVEKCFEADFEAFDYRF
jgi:hypothetical protein